jgi:esterase/lipase superfamily enzyme
MGLRGIALALAGAALAVSLGACSPEDALAPTPSIFAGATALVDAPALSGGDQLSLVYVTDRAPTTDPETGAMTYGAGRSHAMSFGTIAVDIERPSSGDGGKVKLGPATEIGRFPQGPYTTEPTPKGIRRTPDVVAAHESAVAALQGEIGRRLAGSQRKEVVFFIHGYANTFDDAARTMGNLCHYLGHDFVCVVLTWPAGGKGVFMGYNVDRESSEFAVADMKKAIRAISDTPGVRTVHFIAHSRGTDVLTSAMQQLGIEAYSSRSSLSQQLKVKNVVLFAPDIDIDVASTKLFGAVSDPDALYGSKKNPNGAFPQGNVHLTIYSSPDDKALGLSSFLFSSNMRLGQQDLDRSDARAFGEGKAGLVDFIEVNGTTDMFGHGYFLSNPAVSSDLVAMIRYGLKPGDPGRPLTEIRGPFWRLGGSATANAQ